MAKTTNAAANAATKDNDTVVLINRNEAAEAEAEVEGEGWCLARLYNWKCFAILMAVAVVVVVVARLAIPSHQPPPELYFVLLPPVGLGLCLLIEACSPKDFQFPSNTGYYSRFG